MDYSSEKIYIKFIKQNSRFYKRFNSFNNIASLSIPSEDVADIMEFDIYTLKVTLQRKN